MFRPKIYVKDVFTIDYLKLKNDNVKLLAFDLDNTLDFPDKHTNEIDEKIKLLINDLKKDFHVMIISNNRIKGRVESFCSKVDLEYIEAANKPFIKKYKNSKIISDYKSNEVAYIGDKIITDIIGANRMKSISILVDPLHKKPTNWYTYIMVYTETIFCKFINFKRGKYYG